MYLTRKAINEVAANLTSDARRLSFLGLCDREYRSQVDDRINERAAVYEAVARCAENGLVALVESGMDCDCVRYANVVRYCFADPRAVLARIYEIENDAEGCCSVIVERPTVAAALRYSSRDLALEAFEDGHPHVVYA
jgi:hypothetical protein